MKTDLYTKTVLTVIAIALSAIAFQNVNFVSTVTASTTSTSQPTAIKSETVDVNISHIGGVPITNYMPSFTTQFGEEIPRRELYHKEFNLYYGGLPVNIEKNRDK